MRKAGIIFIIYFLCLGAGVSATKQKKKPVIMIGDNVKSRLVKIVNGKKIYYTEFTGHPRVKYDNKELRADKIIVRGNEGEIVEAIGHVVIVDKKDGSKIKSRRAIYYKLRDIVEVIGNPGVVTRRDDDNSIIKVRSQRMEHDLKENIANAYGKVVLKNRDLTIRSEKATLYRNEKKAVFFGNPIMKRGEDIFKANEIIYLKDKKVLILNEKAHVVTFSDEKDTDTGEMKKVRTITEGDRIEHYEEGETLTVVTGNAVIQKESSTFRGERIEIVGKDANIIIGSKVSIDYQDENMKVYGDNFRYYKKEEYSAIWDNAVMIIEDEENHSENTTIYGSYMEFFQDIDELFVNGDVKIFHDTEIIKGDMARFNRKNNCMFVTGNSRVEKGDSVVYADTIIYNKESQDTRLIGDLSGFIIESDEM